MNRYESDQLHEKEPVHHTSETVPTIIHMYMMHVCSLKKHDFIWIILATKENILSHMMHFIPRKCWSHYDNVSYTHTIFFSLEQIL